MKKKILTMFFIFLLVILLSKSIFAVTIVLDPGHGGIDTGAINKKLGIYERNQVWKIANYMQEYLKEYSDVNVYLTCPTFETTGEAIPREERASIMRLYNADLAISLHIDDSTSTKLSGATAYITKLPKFNSEMNKFANILLNNLNKLGINSNGVKTRETESNDGYYDDGTPLDYYGIIRHPTLLDIPIVLLEHCYINNENDSKFIDSDDDLKKLAKADVDSIVEYLKLTKKSDINPIEITQDEKIDGVTFKDLNITKGYITNILAGQTVKDVKSKIQTDYTIKITDKDGKELMDTDIIKNCSKVIIKSKTKSSNNEINTISHNISDNVNIISNEIDSTNDISNSLNIISNEISTTEEQEKIIATYIITIYGDINCDGLINSVDLLVLQRHILEITRLDEIASRAGNISKDGSSPTSIDLLKIQRHILEIESIK